MRKGSKASEETRRKMSLSRKGKPTLLKGRISPLKGRHRSEEIKQKISKAMKGMNKGKLLSEETKKRMSEAKKGKSTWIKGSLHSEETRRKISKTMKGRLHSEVMKKRMSIVMKGRHHSEETRRKISEAHKGKFGNKSSNWQGGVSFLPYPLTFNNELKQFIRDRDHNECQNPFCNYLSKKLTIHHIDFDKDNCSQFNLITLCNSCNGRANNKYRWQRLYKKILWSKYE